MADPATLIAVGTLAAQVAISLIFRAKPQNSQGPRLTDLQISTSAFGEHIDKGYGTGPMAGDLLWLKGNKLDEVANTQKTGGKGFGGSASHTDFEYFATFIMGFGQGPASGVRRIWADEKLIYDVTGANETVAKAGLAFRFRGGTEEQNVDPDYAADVGADMAVPMRGEVYITFLNYPLKDHGNRIPNIEAEIVFEPTSPQIAVISGSWEGGMGHDQNSTDTFMFDYLRNRLLVNDMAGALQVGAVIDAATLTTIGRGGIDGVPEDNWFVGVDPVGDYFGVLNGDNVVWDSVTFLQVGINASSRTFPRSIQPFRLITEIAVWEALAGYNQTIGTVTGRMSTATGIRFWLRGTMGDHSDWQPFGGNTRPRSMTLRGDGTGRVCYIVFDASDASSLHIYQYKIVSEPRIDVFGISPPSGIDQDIIGSIAATDIDPGASVFTIGGCNISHDRSDDSLTISFELDSDAAKQYLIKWSETAGVIWKTGPLTGDRTGGDPLISHRENGSFNRLEGHSFAWVNRRTGASVTDRLTQISLADGSIIQNAVAVGSLDGNNDGDSIWDDRKGRIYNADQSGPLRGVLNLLPKVGAAVADIYRDRCDNAGIDKDNELNVSAITDTIPFFAKTAPQSERETIEPLMLFFGHSGGTEDNELRFVPLGGAEGFVIDEADMEPGRDGNDPIELTKVQELELPGRVEVVYADIDQDFEQGTQRADRIGAPVAGTRSRVVSRLDIQGGLTADDARKGAERALIRAWNERDRLAGRPGIEFIEFTPGIDAGRINRLDGSTQRLRLASYGLGADWSIEAKFVAEELAQFVDSQSLASDPGRGKDQVILSSAPSQAFMLNTTTLRDVDAVTDRSFSRVLWGAAPFSDLPWAGGLLYRMTGDSEFEKVGQTTSVTPWGKITIPPPASDQAWRTEPDSFFEAVMVTGFDDIQSVLQADFYAGVNAAYLYKAATGEGEAIFFRDFTDLGDNRGRFSVLSRGVAGTDVYLGQHAVGDMVVLLNRAALDDLVQTLSSLDVQKRFRMVSGGQELDEGATQDFTPLGNDLMPWEPGSCRGQSEQWRHRHDLGAPDPLQRAGLRRHGRGAPERGCGALRRRAL